MPLDANKRSTKPRGRPQPGRRQTAHGGWLDRGVQTIPSREKLAHDALGLSIVRDRDSNVHVSRSQRLGTRAHRETADQRPRPPDVVQVGYRSPERCFERRLPRGQLTTFPTASPALGRVRRHSFTRRSIAERVSVGRSLRSFARSCASASA
jgi:hypothetical protein